MAESGYTYFAGECGIDMATIKDTGPGRFARIKGGSGRRILYSASEYSLVFLADDPGLRLPIGYSARMGATHSGGLLGLDLYTRFPGLLGKRGLVHPDFFAREFVGYTIKRYFPQRGVEIKRVRGDYFLGSVNYAQFVMALIGGSSREEAARRTWAGQVLGELGFAGIEERESERGVEFHYLRE